MMPSPPISSIVQPLTVPEAPGVYVRYPEWSPKGDRVLFERGASRGNIWTIAID